jgi:hypothetical protein
MNFSLKLLETDSQVRNSILVAMKEILDKALVKALNSMEPKVRILLRSALHNEPEYVSLISGDLRKEFGIQNTNNVDVAIDNMVNSINFSISKISSGASGLTGGITLTIIPKDLNGIINDSSAYIVDTERGYSLPWLEWLLTKGGEVIVRNFEVRYGANPKSRSGDAIMVSSSSNWRVPAQFAGTINNNWITRALSTIEDQIAKTLETELRAAL